MIIETKKRAEALREECMRRKKAGEGRGRSRSRLQ